MFVLVMIILLVNPGGATEGAIEGLKLAFETVIPSILPFAVFSSAFVYSGGSIKLARALSPVFNRLSLNPLGATAFLSGALGGYPTGCRVVCDMYKEGMLDKSEAEKMLAYVNNGGVVFALNICGEAAFSSKRAGAIIFISAIAASVVAALVISKSDKRETIIPQHKKSSLMASVGKSVASGGEIIINILSAFVVFYALIYALKLDKFPLLAGVAEMTRGVMLAGQTGSVALGAFFFSLGGISVLMQSAALCARGDLSLKKYILGKIISAPTACIIAYILAKFKIPSTDVVLFSLLSIVCILCAVASVKSLHPVRKN